MNTNLNVGIDRHHTSEFDVDLLLPQNPFYTGWAPESFYTGWAPDLWSQIRNHRFRKKKGEGYVPHGSLHCCTLLLSHQLIHFLNTSPASTSSAHSYGYCECLITHLA
jgi:hypothetical protein